MCDEDKYRIARVELVHICPQYGNFEGQELEFNYTLRTLSLHLVGSHALPLDRRLQLEEDMCVFAQMAATSRLTLVYNQKRLLRALEVDKQSSLAEMVKSESAGDAGQDHHGENLSFAVFNSQSKVVLDMHREELVHVESSASTPEMLLKMPLASISGVVDKQGSARVIKFSDEPSLSVEIQAVDRIQLTKVSVPINNNIIIVNALQSFEDISQQALMDQESSV